MPATSATLLKALNASPPGSLARSMLLFKFKQARLREDIEACTACSLHEQSSRRVPWSGGPSSVAFVGEAPGRNEDAAGVPFVGRAGRLLDDVLAAVNLPRDSVTVMNTICCRPWKNDYVEAVKADAPARCRPFLRRQLDLSGAWLVVALGLQATRDLARADDQHLSMSKLRGKWWWRDGRLFTSTWHPAYILRNQSALESFTADLQAVADVLGSSALPIPAELPVDLVSRLRGRPSEDHVKVFGKRGWMPLYSHLLGAQVVLVASSDVTVPAPYDVQPRYTVRELVALRPLVAAGEFGFDMRRVHAVKTVLNGEVLA